MLRFWCVLTCLETHTYKLKHTLSHWVGIHVCMFFWQLLMPTAGWETIWANQCSSPPQMVLDWIYYYPAISHPEETQNSWTTINKYSSYLEDLGFNVFVSLIMKTEPHLLSQEGWRCPFFPPFFKTSGKMLMSCGVGEGFVMKNWWQRRWQFIRLA